MLNNNEETMIKLKTALVTKKISQLQFNVYKLLLTIPPGEVTTYKQIASNVKCNSPRAIGQALRRNPFAPDVPCHRVVKSNLTLGGFSGGTTNKTVEKKMKLLMSEGVTFQTDETDQCCDATVSRKHLEFKMLK